MYICYWVERDPWIETDPLKCESSPTEVLENVNLGLKQIHVKFGIETDPWKYMRVETDPLERLKMKP